MVADTSQELIAIPLKIDGVVVGLVSLGDNYEIIGSYTNKTTESYIKELLLTDMLDSISLIINYAGEKPILGVPESGDSGYLRLVQ